MSSTRVRSVGPASIAPKFTPASSNSQNRSAGFPAYSTGVGSTGWAVCVSGGRGTAAAPSEAGTTDNEYQSSSPSVYSSAPSVTSPDDVRAETAKAYSWRAGFHASAESGSTRAVSYQRSQPLSRSSASSCSSGGTTGSGGSAVRLPEASRSGARAASSRRASMLRRPASACHSPPVRSAGSTGTGT